MYKFKTVQVESQLAIRQLAKTNLAKMPVYVDPDTEDLLDQVRALIQQLEEINRTRFKEHAEFIPVEPGRGGRDVQRDEDFLLPLVTDIPWPRWDYRGA